MARRVLYWVAVVLVSLAILVGVVLFFASRDTGSLGGQTRSGSQLELSGPSRSPATERPT